MRWRLFQSLVVAAILVAACATSPLDGDTLNAADASCTDCDGSSGLDTSTPPPPEVESVDAANPIDASTVDARRDSAPPSGSGCADGTRDALTDVTMYPNVAACGGTWTGDVASAGNLCSAGWHPCIGGDAPLSTVSYAGATAFAGCFAINAAQDDDTCHQGSCTDSVNLGVDSASDIDMGGIGSDCKYKSQGHGSCISGGRIDASANSGTGCNFTAGLTGVVCCRNGA